MGWSPAPVNCSARLGEVVQIRFLLMALPSLECVLIHVFKTDQHHHVHVQPPGKGKMNWEWASSVAIQCHLEVTPVPCAHFPLA